MITITKIVICPECRKPVGQREVIYEGEKSSPWQDSSTIQADFVCSSCRKKIEEKLKNKVTGNRK